MEIEIVHLPYINQNERGQDLQFTRFREARLWVSTEISGWPKTLVSCVWESLLEKTPTTHRPTPVHVVKLPVELLLFPFKVHLFPQCPCRPIVNRRTPR